MPVYTELRFHCDTEGCDFWDTYVIADYGYDSSDGNEPLWKMQSDITGHAIMDGWCKVKGRWYCPMCIKRMEEEE